MNAQQWKSMTKQEREERTSFQERRHPQYGPTPQPPQATGLAKEPGPSRTARRLLTAAVVGLVLIGAVAAGANLIGPGYRTIDGALRISKNASIYSNSSSIDACEFAGGYNDIGTGTPVTVRDGSGDIAGVGELTTGWYNKRNCSYGFTVEDVPASDFYTVEVGHRGEVTISDEDVEKGSVELSLG